MCHLESPVSSLGLIQISPKMWLKLPAVSWRNPGHLPDNQKLSLVCRNLGVFLMLHPRIATQAPSLVVIRCDSRGTRKRLLLLYCLKSSPWLAKPQHPADILNLDVAMICDSQAELGNRVCGPKTNCGLLNILNLDATPSCS